MIKNVIKKSILFFINGVKASICSIRTRYYSSLIDEGGGCIFISDPFIRVKIIKSNGSRLIIRNKLIVQPYLYGTAPAIIMIGKNSSLIINGEFNIGSGVKLILGDNSQLTIGGREFESLSGITSDTLILVSKSIEIGIDFICSWGVFISDSDWHQIDNAKKYKPVRIENHVWIANNCSILKGTEIGQNCVVASHSKLSNAIFPSNSLIGGVPAAIIKSNITWRRDFIS